MRYLTGFDMGQLALEETIAWEQLAGFQGNGDEEYAGGGTTQPPPPSPVLRPLIRVDPYAGMRPRAPSSGVGTGAHATAYGVITEAQRVTKAPTPVYKQPEYKMPAQQAAQKAAPKFDCAAWRLRRCAALAKSVAAQGTVAQMQAAKASEGAISMAQDNVNAAQKAHEAIKNEAGAINCFSAQPAQRLCPGEKADTAYLAPSRGGFPGPFGAGAQTLVTAQLAMTPGIRRMERPEPLPPPAPVIDPEVQAELVRREIEKRVNVQAHLVDLAAEAKTVQEKADALRQYQASLARETREVRTYKSFLAQQLPESVLQVIVDKALKDGVEAVGRQLDVMTNWRSILV